MSLYWAERYRELGDDGLARGGVAVEFITGLAGSVSYFSRFGLYRLGRFLQIVDDVLDLEEDIEGKELNCLSTPRRAQHLQFLRETEQEALALFRNDKIMCLAILRATRKAEILQLNSPD